MIKSVHGIGINDANYSVSIKVDGKTIRCPFYVRWTGMLERCYSVPYLKRYPTYVGGSVAPEWHSFMCFKEWMSQQNWVGNHLDKDIICYGNKVYSPDTCCFVPEAINNLLTKANAIRGPYPIGVCWSKRSKVFVAHCRNNGKLIPLGNFFTIATASNAYISYKVRLLLDVADTIEDDRVARGIRVYALMLNCSN